MYGKSQQERRSDFRVLEAPVRIEDDKFGRVTAPFHQTQRRAPPHVDRQCSQLMQIPIANEAGMKKKLWALFAVLALSLYPVDSPGQQTAPSPAYRPELIEFMVFTQIRHAKLWFAGNAGNWELADYEVDELKEGLQNAAKYVPDYKGIPVGKMIESVAIPPIDEVEKAIKAKDRAKFAAAYDKLTSACNTCHQSANRPFIVIQRPTGSAFPNQSFAPRRN